MGFSWCGGFQIKKILEIGPVIIFERVILSYLAKICLMLVCLSAWIAIDQTFISKSISCKKAFIRLLQYWTGLCHLLCYSILQLSLLRWQKILRLCWFLSKSLLDSFTLSSDISAFNGSFSTSVSVLIKGALPLIQKMRIFHLKDPVFIDSLIFLIDPEIDLQLWRLILEIESLDLS